MILHSKFLGGMLGTALGDEVLPLSWRKKLENRHYVERLVHDLAKRAARD
jgi:hypothetical protein